jgi:hypothetical protein
MAPQALVGHLDLAHPCDGQPAAGSAWIMAALRSHDIVQEGAHRHHGDLMGRLMLQTEASAGHLTTLTLSDDVVDSTLATGSAGIEPQAAT